MPDLFANPVSAPHKTKRFWTWVALGLVPVAVAPLYIRLMGFRPPVRVQIQSAIITFATWIAIFWSGFRFGRIAWLVILPLMFAFRGVRLVPLMITCNLDTPSQALERTAALHVSAFDMIKTVSVQAARSFSAALTLLSLGAATLTHIHYA